MNGKAQQVSWWTRQLWQALVGALGVLFMVLLALATFVGWWLQFWWGCWVQ